MQTQKIHATFFVFLVALLLGGCQAPAVVPGPDPVKERPIAFTILQLNDVYEIAPLEGGKVGGLARVATVLKRLKAENPNTISVMAGDFLSPSFVGTLRMDGERVAGKQMIETLNSMGLDYATFGNHEFDFGDLATLESRIDLSDFKYVSANARIREADGSRRPFTQRSEEVPAYGIHTFTGPDGQQLDVALVGILLPFAQQDYLAYEDVTSTFRAAVVEAQREADLVLGLTHLNLDQDIQLAKDVPGLPLFLGGHEHENSNNYVGSTAIMKADANAKTVYVHRLLYYPDCGVTRLTSELLPIDASIPEDPVTKATVDKWLEVQDELLVDMGYDATEALTTIDYVLEGKEVDIRNRQTNYGTLTMEAFRQSWPGAAAYVMNSGSLRLDDNLTGTLTEYDVLRSFPYGGPIVQQTMSGTQLIQLLDTGTATNRGEGGFLQILGPVKSTADDWLIGDAAIVPGQSYLVVLPEFLAQGKESNLGFLGDIEYESRTRLAGDLENDIRDVVIDYLRGN